MTPTVDRLIPLTDAVTANFKIAPIAINTKLEPIRIGGLPDRADEHLKATRATTRNPHPPFGLHAAEGRMTHPRVSRLPYLSQLSCGPPGARRRNQERNLKVIILGIVLVVVGVLVKSLSVLVTIGIILVVVGAALFVLGSMGRAVGGRKHYY
jgi:Family of unknown function (DUF6131)